MTSRPGEQLAERIVLRTLGGRVLQRDDQSQDSMVDLVIATNDGARIAVEVTTYTSEHAANSHATYRKFGGPHEDLTRTWTVRFLRSTRVKQVEKQLLALLHELETNNVHHIAVNSPTANSSPHVDVLRGLGVLAVTAVDGPGWILVSTRAIGSGAADGEILTDVATEVLNDPTRVDNAHKLQATRLDHRHLFIVVSRLAMPTYIEVPGALREGFLPSTHPVADAAYTAVWIAAEDRQSAAFWTRGSGWQRQPSPEEM